MQNTTNDETYMRRCIELALKGSGSTSPNPLVGALLVCKGVIIGEGFHIRAGEGHAEVNALRSVTDSSLLAHSTLFVTLEPCSHYGKTPPCCELIIEKHIPRVVIGCSDVHSVVNGRGIARLREAGVEVCCGVLEEECKALNRPFFTRCSLGRPYVMLKWAESDDGFIDKQREGGTAARLSSDCTLLAVHQLRSRSDAILVGTHTAMLDNPSLTVRHWSGRSPLRVVLDREAVLPPSLHLFDGKSPTWLVTSEEAPSRREPGIEQIRLRFDENILSNLLSLMAQRGINSLLVEGGKRVHESFIASSLWDEIRVEHSPMVLGGGVKAPSLLEVAREREELCFGRVISRFYR